MPDRLFSCFLDENHLRRTLLPFVGASESMHIHQVFVMRGRGDPERVADGGGKKITPMVEAKGV